VGHIDAVLEKLGRNCGMPRGFPLVWMPGQFLYGFGFKPKFANDAREEVYTAPQGLCGLACFKKWSGFLGHLLVFKVDGRLRWAACTKNSANGFHAMVQDCARLFRPYINETLLQEMHRQRLHLNAEMMSSLDQCHGAAVLREVPVVTSMGRGLYADLTVAPPRVVAPSTKAFVEFFGFRETVGFCVAHGLPVDSAIIATGEGAAAFMQRINSERDLMTDTRIEAILHGGGIPDLVLIPGTITHAEVLGDTLEGLVIHQYSRSGEAQGEDGGAVAGGETEAAAIVRAIDESRPGSSVVKFKFPCE
jgi:hypothetical protein